MNTLTQKEYPELFEAINEDYESVESIKQHRRGSSFYCQDIIEIDEDWSEFAPSVTPEMYGFWRTNSYTWSDDYGKDVEISELQRVEKHEKTVVKTEWINVK